MMILQRYDEVMTEKASKHLVAELREDIYRMFAKINYVKDIDELLQNQVEKLSSVHKETLEKFEQLNQYITIEIYSAVKKGILQMSKIVSKAQEDTENKGSAQNKEFLRLIKSKANQQDIDLMQQAKANKIDLE